MKRCEQKNGRRSRLAPHFYSALALKLAITALFLTGSVFYPQNAFAQPHNSSNAIPNSSMTLIVKVSRDAQYVTETPFEDSDIERQLSRRAEAKHSGITASSVMLADTVVRLQSKGQPLEFVVTPDGEAYDLQRNTAINLSQRAANRLGAAVAAARKRHYGELLPWYGLNAKIPKYAKFRVTDLETGLSFRGQRRAGNAHADVQPLSKQDSAIMKQIYGDRWSWERRAVLIHYDGHVWAGSMNGMPHGGDGIPDNGFKGHFCIHFPGSTTHKNRQLDLAHQAMTYKAAGQLAAFLSQLSPKQLAQLWIVAVNQRDKALLQAEVWRYGEPDGGQPGQQSLEFDSIAIRGSMKTKQVRSKQSTTEEIDFLIEEVPLKAAYSVNGKRVGGTIRLTFARTSPIDRWIIEQIDTESDPTSRKSISKRKTPKR